MKIALVYDYLNQCGGGERVLRIFCDLFPEAPIYTIFYDKKKTRKIFTGRDIRTSPFNFSFIRNNHRMFIPLMPFAAQSFSLDDDYDLLISIGAGYSKGINYNAKKIKHLSYCFTPLRYAWEPEFITSKFSGICSGVASFLLSPLTYYLKNWDYKTSQKPDKILTLSHHIARKIRKYYGRNAEVVYLPIDEKKFFYDPSRSRDDYFLAVGRQLHYKKFDLVIETFNHLDLPLKIVGDGPEHKNLQRMATSKKIEFLGFVESDEALRKLYAAARGFIFPQVEDFGLVTVEAQACGTPVLAYAAGGALETIEDAHTGSFFYKQNVSGLTEAVLRFLEIKFDHSSIAESVKQRFSSSNFKKNIYSQVEASVYAHD